MLLQFVADEKVAHIFVAFVVVVKVVIVLRVSLLYVLFHKKNKKKEKDWRLLRSECPSEVPVKGNCTEVGKGKRACCPAADTIRAICRSKLVDMKI